MSEETIATFVHVSDLHFGSINESTGDVFAPNFWAKVPWFDGVMGHDLLSLSHLHAFFAKMRREQRASLSLRVI